MAFHETPRFPNDIARGMAGGPTGRTQIVPLASGREERNSPWATFRHRFDVAKGVRCAAHVAELKAFYLCRHGPLYGFRLKDFADYKSCGPDASPSALDQQLGIAGAGGQAVFQLVKHYESGLQTYTRPIAKPVADTVLVAVDGTPLAAEDFEVDLTTGVVTLDAPAGEGLAVTAGFEFDVPVRFESDELSAVFIAKRQDYQSLPPIPLIEIPP